LFTFITTGKEEKNLRDLQTAVATLATAWLCAVHPWKFAMTSQQRTTRRLWRSSKAGSSFTSNHIAAEHLQR